MRKAVKNTCTGIGVIAMLAAGPFGWLGLLILGKNNDDAPIRVLGAFLGILLIIGMVCLFGAGLGSS